jgi:anti-sigma factor RsiW
MTRCDRRAKQSLEALFRGELDAEGFTRLRAHVAECSGCREAYDKLGRVESVLEKRALPASREALLEKELFARLGVAAKPARVLEPERRRGSFFQLFLVPAAMGLAAALVLLVVGPRVQKQEPEWQARGGEPGTSAWGLRAFCVGADGQVSGEALPGGTLACGEGGAVQFSYTAPRAARLTVEASSPAGEPLRFFPREDEGEVAAGVDVPLSHSTPVMKSWLAGPLEVRATFVDEQGRPISETRLTLIPK